MNLQVTSTSHHRNGVSGDPFNVSLFTDEDGTKKVAIDFGGSAFAVLQVDLLAKGDIAFGSNSWRGDHYMDEVRAGAKKLEDSVTDDALYVRYPVRES